ncbi:MAG: hypothetical protein K0U74_09105 [Alphaproteobacteria bacterium]|nr:hypothetical protein [Alphaproteobacteria bacterium]
MKFALFIALALIVLPNDTLKSATTGMQTGLSNVVSICEERAEDCDAVRNAMLDAADFIAVKASGAAQHLAAVYQKSKQQIASGLKASRPDRGTLRAQDLQPEWRGQL